MPNYNLVVNTQFKNRSFEDMIRPLLMYTQEYNAIEDAASDLAIKASVWEGMANEQSDPKAYAQYKRYADDLQRQAVNLSQNGLNPTSRRELLNLKRRYASEITPIEQAYANRKAQADEQRKALLQNPTLLLSRRADMTSLDDYMRNPQLGYDSYNGALLTQQVGQAASSLARELRNYGNGKRLDSFTKTWLQQHGYTAAEVAQAINNPDSPKSSAVLNTIVNNVMADSGIPQWADRTTLDQAYSYARQGLWNAIGETKIASYTDEAAKIAAQEASQMRVARAAAQAAQNNLPLIDPTPKFDQRNVRTDKDIAATAIDTKMFEKYGKYFKKNPKSGLYYLTKEGLQAYKDSPYVYRGPYSTARDHVENEFKEWLDRRGLSEMAQGRPGKYQTSIIESMKKRIDGKLDTRTATEYIGLIDPDQYKDVTAILNRTTENKRLQNYTRVKKQDGSYEFAKSDKINVPDKLGEDAISSAVPVYGIHGNYLEVTFKSGYRLTIPYENISSNYNALVTGNVNEAQALELKKKQGIETFTYSNGQTVPIDMAITDALNRAHDNFLSGLATSKVAPQTIKKGVYIMH